MLYKHPITSAKQIVDETGLAMTSVNRILTKMAREIESLFTTNYLRLSANKKNERNSVALAIVKRDYNNVFERGDYYDCRKQKNKH
jgi:hypothetical protein